MILKILQAGEPVLRQTARALSRDEILAPQTQQLIELMRATMHDAPGVGLAAPQIGQPVQLAVIEDRPESMQHLSSAELQDCGRRPVPFHVIVNPELQIADATPLTFYEGCLSISGFVAQVPRASAVQVNALNEKAEPVTIDAQGWYARILQHEIGHLHGELYIDRMQPESFATAANYQRFRQEIN